MDSVCDSCSMKNVKSMLVNEIKKLLSFLWLSFSNEIVDRSLFFTACSFLTYPLLPNLIYYVNHNDYVFLILYIL